MTDDERRSAGETMRRKVLSDAYVDRRRSATTAFNRDLEDVITRFAWARSGPGPGSTSRSAP
jgi:hypothetical protein